jgi:hypothetical protein
VLAWEKDDWQLMSEHRVAISASLDLPPEMSVQIFWHLHKFSSCFKPLTVAPSAVHCKLASPSEYLTLPDDQKTEEKEPVPLVDP